MGGSILLLFKSKINDLLIILKYDSELNDNPKMYDKKLLPIDKRRKFVFLRFFKSFNDLTSSLITYARYTQKSISHWEKVVKIPFCRFFHNKKCKYLFVWKYI